MNRRGASLEDKISRFMGQVAIHWNSTELSLQQLIVEYLKLKHHVGWLIVGNMNNGTRCDILRAAVEELEQSDAVKEHLLYAIKLFDRSRENRNLLLHSVCEIDEGTLWLLRPDKGISNRLKHIETNWTELDKILTAIILTESYISSLQMFLRHRKGGKPSSLPDNPPLPDKLTMRLLFPEDAGPPQRSSPA